MPNYNNFSKRNLYFGTFGNGQVLANKFVIILADNYVDAHRTMSETFGTKFCTVYDYSYWLNEKGEPQDKTYGYKLIMVIDNLHYKDPIMIDTLAEIETILIRYHNILKE